LHIIYLHISPGLEYAVLIEVSRTKGKRQTPESGQYIVKHIQGRLHSKAFRLLLEYAIPVSVLKSASKSIYGAYNCITCGSTLEARHCIITMIKEYRP
jgi:hypothetical protein